MSGKTAIGMSAVRSEGAILPQSILTQMLDQKSNLPGMRSEDYGLSGETPFEAASRAWNALQAPWRAFRKETEFFSGSETGTALTRRFWLNQVLKALDYGALDTLRQSIVLGEKQYPVSHFYNHSPIHLIGYRLDLDKKEPGAQGAAKNSPHGLVQLYLNASADCLWGFVSNGLIWRVLRDNISLSRQAMVEFNLEEIMDGQLYNEFLLFYLLCHQSRVKCERPEDCWLEQWSQMAAEAGTRALGKLRAGVRKAIETLGQGFLKHPESAKLRELVRSGELTQQDYYRQLLRIVYRLLFLFVAEDRDLLLPRETSERTRRFYTDNYSTQRLRRLAENQRGSYRYSDLYEMFLFVVNALGSSKGCFDLALNGLGGYLFSHEACIALKDARISNLDFLEAIRSLCLTDDEGRRTRVDYKNLGTEELGSVYESLLELHPFFSSEGASFELRSVSGNERKTTGSYYTPDSLIQCLLDTALDPVVEEALKKAVNAKDAEDKILSLNIIDPAVGSGHFLIAAARRLGKRLAQVRSKEEEPSPNETKKALRDVIGHCLYGVDINPMSAELCKVALWMEAMESGKPLSFLDHHIRVGNSLLGTTIELIKQGIPDEAFEAKEGDDKTVCAQLKKQNKQERGPQGDLFEQGVFLDKEFLRERLDLEEMPEKTPDDVTKKANVFLKTETALSHERAIANAWCAAFVSPKTKASAEEAITTAKLTKMIMHGYPDSEAPQSVRKADKDFAFLHPELAFPEVFANGGFDVVLGNPPWEQVQFEPKEFFASRNQTIANAQNMTMRNNLIGNLIKENPVLYKEYTKEIERLNGIQSYIHGSRRFPLTSFGRINTAPLFAELSLSLLAPAGRAGIIVPSGISTDSFNQYFFSNISRSEAICSIFDFENGMRDEEVESSIKENKKRSKNSSNDRLLFPDVDARFKFSLLTLTGSSTKISSPKFAFFCHKTSDLKTVGKAFHLTSKDINLLNPNTKTCPVFSMQRDADITKAIYYRIPVLIKEEDEKGNPWNVKPQLMFMMNTASHLFRTAEQMEGAGGILSGNIWTVQETVSSNGQKIRAGKWLPLYEAKMAHIYDHRWATYDIVKADKGKKIAGDLETRDMTIEEKINPGSTVMPRYWLHEDDVNDVAPAGVNWFIGFRDICRSTDVRTAIFGVLPRTAVGHNLPLLHVEVSSSELKYCLLSNFSSYILDYIARQAVGGTHLTFFILKQLPVVKPTSYYQNPFAPGEPLPGWIARRVLELTYSAEDLRPFAEDLGYAGEPFVWNEERRFLLKAELDALYFHLYGIERDDVEYIMETFPIVKRKEIKEFGSFRSKETILAIYDKLSVAQKTGVAYQTLLDPAPAAEWTPPALPPIEELMQAQEDAKATTGRRRSRGKQAAEEPAKVIAKQEALDFSDASLAIPRFDFEPKTFAEGSLNAFAYEVLPQLVGLSPNRTYMFYFYAANYAAFPNELRTILINASKPELANKLDRLKLNPKQYSSDTFDREAILDRLVDESLISVKNSVIMLLDKKRANIENNAFRELLSLSLEGAEIYYRDTIKAQADKEKIQGA